MANLLMLVMHKKTTWTNNTALNVTRRRSIGAIPLSGKGISSSNPASYSCIYRDPVGSSRCCGCHQTEETADCSPDVSYHTCILPSRTNLDKIKEVRESAEDLLDSDSPPCVSSSESCVNGAIDSDIPSVPHVHCNGKCGSLKPDCDSTSNLLSGSTCNSVEATATSLGGQCNSVGVSCGSDRPTAKRHLRRSCTWQYQTDPCGEEDNICDFVVDSLSADQTTSGSEGSAKSSGDPEDHDSGTLSPMGPSKPIPPVTVNSHLHCHSSTIDLASPTTETGGQTLTSEELKTKKTLLLIMREMIQTERDYVKSLEYVIENYIPELLREDIPQALRGQRNVIFGNIEKIFEFHNQFFLQELERCEHSPFLVGHCFLRHEQKFYLYALYNKNKPKSDNLMSEYGAAFFKRKQLELGDKMDLSSYLLKPVQRMGKYALLLQQLIKACQDQSHEKERLLSAEQMVRFQLRHGNDLLAMDSLRDCDVNVKEQGRLLRQNEFLVWTGKNKKCLRHVFLFEDLILFSKSRRDPERKNLDIYFYKSSMKMTDIGLTAQISESSTKFEIWFRKRKPNDTFTLQSMSPEIKQSWTDEISKLLWKQALKNREMRMAEMSSMGIGNKPCLDIRPSADQISDRSISIVQLNKTAPRFRNSIAVSGGEHLRNPRRPHSIISVSSSSSGSSGSSSSYALINLGFDPGDADSPHPHHRSATLHSQCSMESGIIADISMGGEDADGSQSHWRVERSNSSVTSTSLDSSLTPGSPASPITTIKVKASSPDDSAIECVDNDETVSIKL